MDLDKLKKSWQEADVTPTIHENKIQKMLDNKGKGAFENLLRVEKIFFWLLIPCAFAGLFFYHMHPLPGIVYFALLIPAFFWQAYKIRTLKKIDLSNMGILEVSKCMVRYKKNIFWEIIVGVVWVIIFFIFYVYWGLPAMFPRLYNEDSEFSLLILLIGTIVLSIVIGLVLYKYLYINNIKKVQDSIREIEEFEKED